MTVDVLAPPRVRGAVARRLVVPVVPIAVAAVFVLRLPLVQRPASPDEAGFLMVASQWHVGGTSLYGDYWVDRPSRLRWPRRRMDGRGGGGAAGFAADRRGRRQR